MRHYVKKENDDDDDGGGGGSGGGGDDNGQLELCVYKPRNTKSHG